MRDRPAAASELRLRLDFVERLLGVLRGVEQEEDLLGKVAQLAAGRLARACWIFLRGEAGEVRLARAAQAGSADPPELPDRLLEQVNALLGTGTRAARRSPIRIALLEQGGSTLGALALLTGPLPAASFEWALALLAAQASAALAGARVRARLQHEVQLRDDVVVAAAHELGNSLGALALQVRAMLGESAARGHDLPRLGAMDFQISRLIALNRRMLDSARPGAGQFPLKLETVDATAVLREVLARNADELAWRRCQTDFRDPGPLPGRWDRDLLDQIFSNLLSNAMKYGHGRPISLSLRGSRTTLRFQIEDRGIGIAPADQQRIFEKFERAAPIEQGTSLGIGLWLVRRMTQAMGGTTGLTSAPGAGSIFSVQLPRKTPGQRPAREVPT